MKCMTRSEAKQWVERLYGAGCKAWMVAESLHGVTRSTVIKYEGQNGYLDYLRTPEDCEQFLARITA